MNRKKLSNGKTKIKNKKIIRCKNKMVPVFESDICDSFSKKVNVESNNICKNCVHSF